jgi:hypothetical protein
MGASTKDLLLAFLSASGLAKPTTVKALTSIKKGLFDFNIFVFLHHSIILSKPLSIYFNVPVFILIQC